MEHKLSQVIEAVLLSASRPIDVQEIERVFPEDEKPTREENSSSAITTEKSIFSLHFLKNLVLHHPSLMVVNPILIKNSQRKKFFRSLITIPFAKNGEIVNIHTNL